ncbi:MAG: Ig domain protein group 2 domain protein [Flavipsychrobacter sp.]|jgi:hypothetical protein|nr:Ig domain protein group 2 domain protein [Flavipsychrobacter sp.]
MSHYPSPGKVSGTIIKYILLLSVALLPFVSKAQAVSGLTNPSTCGGTDGVITITGLLTNQFYIIQYSKNGVPLPGAYAQPTDGSGALHIVTFGTFTVGAGTYTGILVSDGVTPSFFPGPYVLTDPPATINAVSNQSLCNGATTTAVSFTGTGTTFNWTNNNTSIGLAASGSGNIAPFMATNASSAPVTATITVTPSVGGSCIGTPTNFTITVNPTPTVNAVASQARCNGFSTSPVAFSGTVPGTTYTWTNNTTSIGLAAGGTGNIASFVAVNTTTAPVVATVTVTPSANGCPGPAGNFTITVNPTPTVNAVANQTVCNGATVAAVNFSSAVSGTTYGWTNSAPSIGLAASGTGNIAAFSGANAISSPVTATIAVNATANTCIGPNTNFTITVNPTPTVNTIANQALCNGATSTAVSFSGNVPGTTYSWTNNTTSIGLGASGTGNIAAFAATNFTSAPVAGTITVMPSANGCPGTPRTFIITVNPTPTVNTVGVQDVCNGNMTSAVTFAGPVSGTTFNWVNNNTSIGLAASGTGGVPAFAIINNGVIPVQAVVTITPSANGCTGPTNNFSYYAYPTPMLSSSLTPPAICSNTPFSYTPTSATIAATFTWSRAAVAGISNAASAGSGNPNETLINTTPNPVTVTYVFTASAYNCHHSENVTVTVYPAPKLNSPLTATLCGGEEFNYTPTSATPGTSFTWARPGATGTGAIKETLSNNSTGTVTVPYVYTLTANGCSTTEQVVLTLHNRPQLPVIAIMPHDQLCANTMYQNFGAATPPPAGTTYAWKSSNGGVWKQSANGQNALVNFPNTGAAEVMLTATITTTGCDTTATYPVSLSTTSSPDVEVIYHNGRFVALNNNADSYLWGYDDKLTLDSTAISNETRQDYLNTAPDFANKYYWVLIKTSDCLQKAYYNKPTNAEEPVLRTTALKLYPNPANDILNIELESVSVSQVGFAVYDLTGKLLMNIDAPNRYARVDISSLAQGMYSVICTADGTKIAVAKFVKH